MGEKSGDVRIDQTFNNEFDLLGEYAVQRQIQASLYQGEKLRAAENWLAARANFIALVALIIAATAVANVDPAITAWFKSIFPYLSHWG